MVCEYLVRCWRRSAVSSLAESIGAPLLYLLALGLGLGTLVDKGPGAAALGGLSYLQYLAPALLTAAAMQTGVNEASFPVYARFKWTRVYWGISATPVSARQLADAQVLFIAARLLAGSVLYYLILLIFRVGGGIAGPLTVPIAALSGLSFAVWVLALSAVIRDEGTAFNLVTRFLVIPMTLFSGSFFPIGQLPAVVRPLAWLSPLWHGNELARAALRSRVQLWPDLGHLGFLVVLFVGGLLTVRHRFLVRLVV